MLSQDLSELVGQSFSHSADAAGAFEALVLQKSLPIPLPAAAEHTFKEGNAHVDQQLDMEMVDEEEVSSYWGSPVKAGCHEHMAEIAGASSPGVIPSPAGEAVVDSLLFQNADRASSSSSFGAGSDVLLGLASAEANHDMQHTAIVAAAAAAATTAAAAAKPASSFSSFREISRMISQTEEVCSNPASSNKQAAKISYPAGIAARLVEEAGTWGTPQEGSLWGSPQGSAAAAATGGQKFLATPDISLAANMSLSSTTAAAAAVSAADDQGFGLCWLPPDEAEIDGTLVARAPAQSADAAEEHAGLDFTIPAVMDVQPRPASRQSSLRSSRERLLNVRLCTAWCYSSCDDCC
jgi:hypothetical protein